MADRKSAHIPRSGTGNDTETPTAAKSLTPLSYLVPDHPAVEALGLSAETCEHFECGYAPQGTLCGYLAIPVHDPAGTLVGYVGWPVKDGQQVKFGKSIPRPDLYVFNMHRIGAGDVTLTDTVLDVLLAYEHGVENCIARLMPSAQVLPFAKTA